MLFIDLLDGDDLSLDLPDLVLSLHMVPKLGLCEDWVLAEHSHSVEGGIRDFLRGEAASNDEELPYLHLV